MALGVVIRKTPSPRGIHMALLRSLDQARLLVQEDSR